MGLSYVLGFIRLAILSKVKLQLPLRKIRNFLDCDCFDIFLIFLFTYKALRLFSLAAYSKTQIL